MKFTVIQQSTINQLCDVLNHLETENVFWSSLLIVSIIWRVRQTIKIYTYDSYSYFYVECSPYSASWCKLDVLVTDFKTIRVTPEEEKSSAPPLVTLTTCVKSVHNSKSNQNEVNSAISQTAVEGTAVSSGHVYVFYTYYHLLVLTIVCIGQL